MNSRPLIKTSPRGGPGTCQRTQARPGALWMALGSAQLQSVSKYAGLGKGGGRWGGQRRGVEKEHSLYNSILIVSVCTFLVYMDVGTAIEASGVTRLPLVKAQMG